MGLDQIPFLQDTLLIEQTDAAIRFISAFVLASCAACSYAFLQRRERTTIRNLPYTMILFSVIVAGMMMTVGNSVARAFSLLGAISILRFRLNIKNPTDMAAVLFTITIGIACGIGMIGVAAVFTFVIIAILGLLGFLESRKYRLRRDLLLSADSNVTIHEFLDSCKGQFGSDHTFRNLEDSGRSYLWRISLRFPSKESFNLWTEWLENERTLIFTKEKFQLSIDLTDWQKVRKREARQVRKAARTSTKPRQAARASTKPRKAVAAPISSSARTSGLKSNRF